MKLKHGSRYAVSPHERTTIIKNAYSNGLKISTHLRDVIHSNIDILNDMNEIDFAKRNRVTNLFEPKINPTVISVSLFDVDYEKLKSHSERLKVSIALLFIFLYFHSK